MSALELVVSHTSLPRRRNAESRWYATGRDSRPPMWREITFEILRRALESPVAFRRLLLMLLAVAVAITGATAVLALLVPPHLLTGLAAALTAGSWWIRRRTAAAPPSSAPADGVDEGTDASDRSS